MKPLPEFYTIKEAARISGISASTLRRLDNRQVFVARRSTANYRLYSMQDMYKLIRLLKTREWFDRRLKGYQSAVAKLMPEKERRKHRYGHSV